MHKAGFVNIIGLPNTGKSSLMNRLLGEKLSIVTSKSQTTRHRIKGIINGEEYQIVFSDTPGYIVDPNYKMQEDMNAFVQSSFTDADVFIFLIDKYQSQDELQYLMDKMKLMSVPVLLLLNKNDLNSEDENERLLKHFGDLLKTDHRHTLSALRDEDFQWLIDKIVTLLPPSPPFYDKDDLSDRPERFFVSELIRESIFEQFKQEIPYSCEVGIEAYQEDEDITRIAATIFVARKTQKPIIIGKGGEAIKKLGISSREKIEQFIQSKVYLELHVKVKENWRNNDNLLKSFGYK